MGEVDEVLDFVVNNLMDIVLSFVGLSAFGVYFKQRRDEIRTAATLVKGQIDLIEERIGTLKNDHQLGNIAVYHSIIIIQENLWEKYKHLLVKKLQKSDAAIIQRFFDNAERIEHARSDIIHTITSSWEHKSSTEHQIVGDVIHSEISKQLSEARKQGAIPNFQFQINMDEVEAFRQAYRPLDLVFTPDIAISALVKHLNSFDMLSGTTAYRTIQKLSYDNI